MWVFVAVLDLRQVLEAFGLKAVHLGVDHIVRRGRTRLCVVEAEATVRACLEALRHLVAAVVGV